MLFSRQSKKAEKEAAADAPRTEKKSGSRPAQLGRQIAGLGSRLGRNILYYLNTFPFIFHGGI